jgi:hypothetical protein
MKHLKKLACVASAAVLLSAASLANAAAVSLQLVLAIDTSGSVDASEYNLQRNGYAQAFQSAAVQNAIAATPGGSIAATFVQWSGFNQQQQSIGWTLINDAASASAFAASIAALTRPYSGQTGIGAAINFSAGLFDTDFTSARKVIDISGDGTNNSGVAPAGARDAAVAAGITINGLPIGNQSLVNYYQANVIGGSGAFLEPAANFADFADAIGRKLEREIVSTVIPVPGALPLLASGLLAFGWFARRRKA